jgi:hypothetical protein
MRFREKLAGSCGVESSESSMIGFLVVFFITELVSTFFSIFFSVIHFSVFVVFLAALVCHPDRAMG